MPHLHIEIARGVIESQLLNTPIDTAPDGTTSDILAPPAAIQDSLFTPFGTIRAQIIIRTVRLQPIVGSANATVEMSFNESSIEILALGKSIGLLSGHISASATLAVRQVSAAPAIGLNAAFGVDTTNTVATFHFDPPSQARIAPQVKPISVGVIEAAVGAMMTKRLKQGGFQKAGLVLGLKYGVPSEDLLTVDALPAIAWVDAQTLALSLQYAPEPTPPPFQVVPFLPDGPSSFGLRLSNDGFQRTVRNPAMRKLARDVLTARRIDAFVHDAFLARGGVAPVTDLDKADGAKRLNDYLLTPAGLAEIAGETPSPVGGGMLRKPIKNVPDPFSDFDIQVPELDLWLGDGRIEGRIVGKGDVDGFGFEARISFRATPVLVDQKLGMELRDFQIDDPDVDIHLPVYLRWATAIIVGAIAGTLVGAFIGFIMSAVLSALVEAMIPSNLGAIIPTQKIDARKKLPTNVSIARLDVTPEALTLIGRWSVFIDDPRPFYPRATMVDTIDRVKDGLPTPGRAEFMCLGILGVLMPARQGAGTVFKFLRQAWRSTVVVTLETSSIPLPLTRFPWKVAVGYRTIEQYVAMPDPPRILVPGPMAVTATVWNPEPPFLGQTERRSFTIDVRAVGDNGFSFAVPSGTECILLELSTHVIDAAGVNYDVLHYVDVPNETLTFGDDFDAFKANCRKGRRELKVGKVPSLLDELWNPPNIIVERVHEAIQNEEPAVTTAIGSLYASHGIAGLQILLAPSLAGRAPNRNQE
ncbi:MAG: hypothetical protein ABI625_12535 [bacterium]